jgi:hypothetical protein
LKRLLGNFGRFDFKQIPLVFSFALVVTAKWTRLYWAVVEVAFVAVAALESSVFWTLLDWVIHRGDMHV